ncbi:restriction endonuclease subunit S [Pseudoalteromonas sp. DL2-H2.2]|uniref:restriction endonuclease subunit S n=1 Tax=Pseudoalteromonas sp. DL2-H2.2 TaxID=2908889 RepID=UPI001F233B07|nr:restriction endonuclease subunit S [Pseudoalteromonas sp. DL2-H2.2]MCF2909921.1 restriction endonuclease subunit S [Pseudoalteromonas sp. DL2-H2.2]
MSTLDQVIPEGYKQTEVGVIPEDWKCISISDLNPFVTSGSRGWATYYSEFGDPFIRITNMERSSIYLNMENTKFVSLPPDSAEGKRTSLKNTDILISITADIGICSYVDEKLAKPAFINQHIALIRFENKPVNSKFIAYFLSSEAVQKLFQGSADQGAKAGMNLDSIRKIRTALPELQEQTAIANALSDVDALLTELEKLIAKKQAIKTATMQQLLTGKTRLPQFSTYTEGTLEGKNQGVPKGKSKGTKPSELGEIPEDWDVYAIGALFSITAGGDLRKNQFSPIKTDKHPYPIYSNAITNKGLYGYCSTFDYDGECLTITARGGIGHAVERDESFCAIGRLLVLSPKQSSNCKYVSGFANQYIEFSNESTGVPQLTAPQVAKYSIAMPKFEEQTAIATILSDMDNEIQTLEQRLAKTRQIKQGMMQELLTGRTRLPFDKD